LLVVVIIIGILVSIVAMNYINAQNKAKLATIKGNMHSCQVAAESYGTDSAGIFPGGVAALLPYYPGGGGSPGAAAGVFPTNPFSGILNETPVANGISDVQAARNGAVATQAAGQTGYSAVATNGQNTSYAVTGYSVGGVPVPGVTNGSMMVLSNQ
jgi:type II secretory pathway pseudopilin PulG